MKRVLVVVDMQNDFVDGALGFEGAKEIEKVCLEKIKEYESRGDDVIFTLDTHDESYMQSVEGKFLPVPHCIKDSKGWELVDTLKEISKSHTIIKKPTFASLELGKLIEKRGYESVELVGLVSNICVISNAIIAKASAPEARIFVDAKATSSYDKAMEQKAFDILENLHIEVINREK